MEGGVTQKPRFVTHSAGVLMSIEFGTLCHKNLTGLFSVRICVPYTLGNMTQPPVESVNYRLAQLNSQV
jgi:hypothetical protein